MSDSASTWIHRDSEKPLTVDQYFESLTRVIFQAGLNWQVMDRKWTAFKEAFARFDVKKVSLFDDDFMRLVENKEIIRNKAKILAIISNAQKIVQLSEEHGNLQDYLDSLFQKHDVAKVSKILGKDFVRFGPATARIFMWCIGKSDVRT